MKKTLLPLLLLVPCFQGHADELGYTTGAYSRSAFFSLGTGSRQGLAIRLTHEKLALLKGKRITGVTAIYGTKNLEGGTVTAFVTTDLNATPIAEKAQAITSANIPSTTAKWTETTFDTPYTITGEEECLYIGYTGVLTGNYALYSTDRTMDAEGRTFAIVNDAWTDLNGKGRGMANLKAVVDELPQYADILMKSAHFSDYYLAGEHYTLQGEVFNAGTETITSLDVEVTSDQVQTLQLNNLELLPGKTLEITLPDVTAENAGATDLAMKIVKVNGKEDADMTDNGYAEHVFFYPQNMERSMLVESFTGQKCSNCPTGHTTLKRVLEEIPQQTVEVTHHAGYFPDNFTMNEDLQYTLFYGTSSTYAPAFMLNRYPNASTYVPVREISENNITEMFGQVANTHPYASLKLATEYDEATREVTLKFQIQGHEDMGETQNVLNIMMVQDGMRDYQSNGGNNYEHNHTFRGTVTGNEWGLLADFKPGETVTYEKTFTLPESVRSSYWTDELLAESGMTASMVTKELDPAQISFVGYIARYVPNDPALNYVYNCVQAKLGETYTQRAFDDSSDGIENITDHGKDLDIRIEGGRIFAGENLTDIRIFDATGRRYQTGLSLPHGTYIVSGKVSGKTVTKKLIVHP
ncbi:MAG: Omp28-related outer membrane protein [Alloprevotella sp.]